MVNFFLKTNWGLWFLNPLFLCVLSHVFPHCVVLVPCLFHVLTGFSAFLDIAFLDFLVSIFFSGLAQKIVVLLLDKSCKKKYHSFLKETLVFLDFSIFARDLFFHALSSKTFCHYSFFNVFEKYLVSFVSFSVFLFKKKKQPSNKILILFMFSLLVVTLLILHAFLLFSFSSYHVSSPCGLLSLCSFTLSLSLLWFFFKKTFFAVFFFEKLLFSFVHRFLWSCFFLSPLLFRFFSCCSFQSCSLEQDKLTLLLFWQKNSRDFFDPCLCEVLKVCYMQQKIVFNNLNFLQQNKIPQRKRTEKKLISRFARVEDRVRDWRLSWPLLRVAT